MNEMKKILLIGTGGTIASEVTDSGLAPELTTEQLLSHLPAVSDICDVECLQLLNLDSTNMTPANWLEIAACIRERYGRYDGFVITHGTDTMAYTAAGLSYLIQGSPKPIVLTGAQKPIGFDSTDSKVNLTDALRCAAEDLPGVSIVFNSRVILGTRARKTRSKSFQAFSSINFPYLAVLRDGVLLRYIRQECLAAPVFYDRLDPRVALLKLVPGAGREAADFLLERNHALIIESFGVGGLPEGRQAAVAGGEAGHRPLYRRGLLLRHGLPLPLHAEHLEQIEGEMRKICKEKLKLERFELPREEALKFMEEKGEPFKVELIHDLPEDAVTSPSTSRGSSPICAPVPTWIPPAG